MAQFIRYSKEKTEGHTWKQCEQVYLKTLQFFISTWSFTRCRNRNHWLWSQSVNSASDAMCYVKHSYLLLHPAFLQVICTNIATLSRLPRAVPIWQVSKSQRFPSTTQLLLVYAQPSSLCTMQYVLGSLPNACLFLSFFQTEHRNTAYPFLYKHHSWFSIYLFSSSLVKYICYNSREPLIMIVTSSDNRCGSAKILIRIQLFQKFGTKWAPGHIFLARKRSLGVWASEQVSLSPTSGPTGIWNVSFLYFGDS